MPSYPRLRPPWRARVSAWFRHTRQRLAFVHEQEARRLPRLQGFQAEALRLGCARVRRETRLQLAAVRDILHQLFG